MREIWDVSLIKKILSFGKCFVSYASTTPLRPQFLQVTRRENIFSSLFAHYFINIDDQAAKALNIEPLGEGAAL